MRKAFIKQKIHNLNDLDEEQDRLGDACRRLEKDMIDSVMDPVKIAGFVFSQIMARKSKKKRNDLKKRRKMENGVSYLKKPAIEIQKVEVKKKPGKFKTIIKSATTSLIKLQLMAVGIYGLTVLITYLRKKPKVKVVTIKR